MSVANGTISLQDFARCGRWSGRSRQAKGGPMTRSVEAARRRRRTGKRKTKDTGAMPRSGEPRCPRLTRRSTGHTDRPRLRGLSRKQRAQRIARERHSRHLHSDSMKITHVPSSEQIEAAANQRIERRRDTGRALVEVATQLQNAHTEVDKLTAQYADVYRDATTDAWTVKELSAQGLPAPDQPVRRRRRSRSEVQTESVQS